MVKQADCESAEEGSIPSVYPMQSQARKKQYQEQYREDNRQKLREYAKKRRRVLKQEALDHYGIACKACGFSDVRALQIDHVDNNGAEERKKLGGQQFAGWRFYLWLKEHSWPLGYQTLCANCNMIKQLGEDF